MIKNNLEGIELSELKSNMDFMKNRNGEKYNFMSICDLYENCSACPIGKSLGDGVDCQEMYLIERYKDIITENLVEDIHECEFDYCNMDCITCKFKDIYKNKDDCNMFVEAILSNFTILSKEEIEEKMRVERLETKINVLEKKLDIIIKMLIEKNN